MQEQTDALFLYINRLVGVNIFHSPFLLAGHGRTENTAYEVFM